MKPLPADMVVVFDASQTSTIKYLSTPPQPGYLIDTAGSAVQGTGALQPTYDTNTICTGPGFWVGSYGYTPPTATPTYLTQAAAPFQIPISIAALMQSDGVATIYEMSADASSSIGIRVRSDTAPTLEITGPGGTMTANATAGWFTGNNPGLVTVTTDGTLAGTLLKLNGVAVALTPAGTAPGAQALTTVPAVYGAAHGGAEPMTGAMGFFGVVPGRVITAQEITNIIAYLNLNGWYIPPQGQAHTRNNIACGDSIYAGHSSNAIGADDKTYSSVNYSTLIIGARNAPGVSQNFAISAARLVTDVGATLSVLTQWNTLGVPAIVSGMKNVIYLEGGINDIVPSIPTNDFPGAQASALTVLGLWNTVLTQVVSNLHGVPSGGNGNHVVAVNTISKDPGSLIAEAAVYLFNQLFRTRYAGYSVSDVTVILCDIGGDYIIGNETSPSYLPAPAYNVLDTIHPAKPGQAHWGGRMARTLINAGV
jgi:hypothetical protein